MPDSNADIARRQFLAELLARAGVLQPGRFVLELGAERGLLSLGGEPPDWRSLITVDDNPIHLLRLQRSHPFHRFVRDDWRLRRLSLVRQRFDAVVSLHGYFNSAQQPAHAVEALARLLVHQGKVAFMVATPASGQHRPYLPSTLATLFAGRFVKLRVYGVEGPSRRLPALLPVAVHLAAMRREAGLFGVHRFQWLFLTGERL